jgi:hypothetical protein
VKTFDSGKYLSNCLFTANQSASSSSFIVEVTIKVENHYPKYFLPSKDNSIIIVIKYTVESLEVIGLKPLQHFATVTTIAITGYFVGFYH